MTQYKEVRWRLPKSLDKAEGWGSKKNQLVAGKGRLGRESKNQCERKQMLCVSFIRNILP